MPIYQVRPGMRFGASNQYSSGDKVKLSPEEAAGFLDKLELVEETKATDDSGSNDNQPGSDDLAQIVPWNGLDPKLVALLEEAGVTEEMVPTITDEELTSIDGIGPKALEKIRSAFGGNTE